ncbi:MAG: bifunctional hydroxymethylpyrimidine kinase/phosphomethylpyrimidine kinase [Acidobacteriota bacterium]|nr:MAG: bifunctional hydroxymethylpyrimidine kinase/phosphomethylpyrimidine kinase [Acidobacteriota bacterium]
MENRSSERANIPRALTIAGSDSGGCAGIQADLKTFGALHVHGMTAITSITSQDTCKVHAVQDLPVELIVSQIRVVADDIGVDAAKTGMLSCVATIEAVAETVNEVGIPNLVVDPVMVATSGDPLIRAEAVDALIQRLLPLALIVTPNLHEAGMLVGESLQTEQQIQAAAAAIAEMGPRHVVIKGGHRTDQSRAIDLHYDGSRFSHLDGPWVETTDTHGSGCTFAAAITAFLARGRNVGGALREAKVYVSRALQQALPLGKGSGPLGHFYEFWKS